MSCAWHCVRMKKIKAAGMERATAPNVKDTRIFVRLSRDDHSKFGAVCSTRGITMSDAVRAMIEKEISK